MDLVVAEISSIRTISPIMVSLLCYRTFSVAKDWPAQISQTWLMSLPSMQNTPTGPIFKMMSTTKFFHIYKKNVESQLLEQSEHVGVATMPYGKIFFYWSQFTCRLIHHNLFRLASYPESEWSVIFHTSHPGLIESLGEDEATIYQKIGHDMLLLNSAWEPESVRAGGLMNQILGNKFQARILNPKLLALFSN